MSVLMQVSGVTGESKLGDQQGWLSLTGFSWGGDRGRSVSAHVGAAVSRVFTKPQLREVTVVREADSASSQLWAQLIQQSALDVKIRWLRPEQGSTTHFLEVSLTGARVISLDDTSGGDRPVETLKFSYEEIEIIYFPLDDSVSGSQQVVTYALPTGEA